MGRRRGPPYGQDLRDRVLAWPNATLAEVSARFGVSKSYVSKVRGRLRDLGETTPGPQHNRVPLRLEPFSDALRAQLEAVPGAKLRDLRTWLHATHGVRVSHAVMWKAAARLGLTRPQRTPRDPCLGGRTGPVECCPGCRETEWQGG
jgi:transposase